tara:strand:- start:311 stop:730 length:420 start_codon:yes stop_codon:yes gene_type:complete
MSVQLALLKSNEEVIADIKEYRDSEDNLVSYLFKDPYIVKVKTSQVLVEEKGTPKHEVVYYKWMSLSKDNDIIVNKDWVVCISDPLDTIRKSYEERMNGRDRSTSGRDDSPTRQSESGGGIESDSGTVLNEQSEVDLTD